MFTERDNTADLDKGGEIDIKAKFEKVEICLSCLRLYPADLRCIEKLSHSNLKIKGKCFIFEAYSKIVPAFQEGHLELCS